MKSWLGRATLIAAILPVWTSAAPSLAAFRDPMRSGAWIPVTGTVTTVDRSNKTIGLRHAALETSAAGTENCRFAHANMARNLRPGQDITAIAETDRHPWILDNVRVIRTNR